MEKILITGVSGFIGRNTALEALNQGYEVSGIDLNPCPIKGVKFTQGDIRDKNLIQNLVKDVDYVIHLAAITSIIQFEDDLQNCYDINVNGTFNIINAVSKSNCKKLVYASSSAVYTGEHFSEDKPIDILKLDNHYGKSKLIVEMIAQSYSKFKPIVGLRFFNTYGENENKNYGTSIISYFIGQKKKGEPLIIYGDGKQARDFTYVKDTAKLILRFMTSEHTGIYNIGSGNPIPFNEIANMVDSENKKYVPNPLSSYQYFTKADTTKLLKAFKDFKFTEAKEYIKNSLF